MQQANQNALSWFEIPTRSLEASKTFYETVLQCNMRLESMGPAGVLAVFPYNEASGGLGGALMYGSTGPVTAIGAGGGVLVYLDCSPASIADVLKRVTEAGGQIAMPRMALPPGMGFIARMRDLDGNLIGLHGMD